MRFKLVPVFGHEMNLSSALAKKGESGTHSKQTDKRGDKREEEAQRQMKKRTWGQKIMGNGHR